MLIDSLSQTRPERKLPPDDARFKLIIYYVNAMKLLIGLRTWLMTKAFVYTEQLYGEHFSITSSRRWSWRIFRVGTKQFFLLIFSLVFPQKASRSSFRGQLTDFFIQSIGKLAWKLFRCSQFIDAKHKARFINFFLWKFAQLYNERLHLYEPWTTADSLEPASAQRAFLQSQPFFKL